MANCCICKKKLGVWGEDKLTLETGRECCYQCAPLLRRLEDADDSKLFFARLDELIKKMDNSSTEHDIREEIENKFHEMAIRKEFTRETENSCPVCGMPMKKTDTSCPRCSSIVTLKQTDTDYTKIATIYNNRFDQFEKNPIYEYRVETVADSPVLGIFDKNDVQKILREYAISGWKLHSAFTNEIGKNAALGINATINQTVLIFERCIKAEDTSTL